MNIYAQLPYNKWRDIHCFCYKAIPPKLRAWLCFSGSMTARMRSVSSNVKISVLKHGWEMISYQEQQVLQMKKRQAIIREINMLCDDEIWITARAVIPTESLQGKSRILKNLGAKPLGDVLFRDRLVHRSSFEFQLLRDNAEGDLWTRRSIFYLPHGPLLLTEIFTNHMWQRVADL